MAKEGTVEAPKRVQVSKIHFLIHPGFLYDSEVLSSKDRDLMDRYIDKATTLQLNEIMIAMLHPTFGKLQNDFRDKKPYTQKLSELKRVLGKRLIALSDSNFVSDNSFLFAESYQRAREIAERRGYFFDPDVESEVYGETSGVCVPLGGRLANESLRLQYPTTILLQLTNTPYESPNLEDILRRWSPRLRLQPAI